MQSQRGRLIARVFRKVNLMKAGVRYTADDLTVEETQVLELIELEKPVSQLANFVEKQNGA